MDDNEKPSSDDNENKSSRGDNEKRREIRREDIVRSLAKNTTALRVEERPTAGAASAVLPDAT
jgi:hypothetical protein